MTSRFRLRRKTDGIYHLVERGRKGRYVTSTGTSDQTAALEFKIQYERDHQAGSVQFSQAASDYLDHLRTRNVAPGTIRDTATFLSRFQESVGDPPLNSLSVADLESWIYAQWTRGLSGSTLRRRIKGTLSPLWNVAIRNGLADENPARLAQMPKTPRTGRARYLTPDEYAALYDATPVPFRYWLDAMVGTGMRPGESFQLQRHHVSLDSSPPTLTITPTTDPQTGEVLRLKTFESRTLNLRDNSLAIDGLRMAMQWALDTYGPECPWVFPVRGGRRRREPSSINYFFRDWLQSAGLARDSNDPAKIDPYSLRHTFACWWLLAREGEGIHELSRLLGHSSVTTTERNYVHILAEHYRIGTAPAAYYGKKDRNRTAGPRKGAQESAAEGSSGTLTKTSDTVRKVIQLRDLRAI